MMHFFEEIHGILGAFCKKTHFLCFRFILLLFHFISRHTRERLEAAVTGILTAQMDPFTFEQLKEELQRIFPNGTSLPSPIPLHRMDFTRDVGDGTTFAKKANELFLF